ncbi:TIGR04255 family protein [Acetobacterium carbinolicum]|uniref:TIGR04255 family protein n=1 Tax=Acetobacterium carbinolicum TaxID=52690 RepID=UPI0039C8FC4E
MSEKYDALCYPKNYIDVVICKLDFASEISELAKIMPKEINNEIKKHFPIAEPQDIIGGEFQINGNDTPSYRKIIGKSWNFLSRNRKNKCTITQNEILFTLNEYNTFEEFKEMLQDVFNGVFNKYGDGLSKRLGLRYVNIIPLNGETDLITDGLINFFKTFKGKDITRQIISTEYSMSEKGFNVNQHCGYINKDYPSIMKSDDFLIDIDAFTNSLLYPDDLVKMIDEMHEEIQDGFEAIITEKLRAKMR